MGYVEAMLRPSRAKLSQVGAKLGQVGSNLGQVGAKLGQVEAKVWHVVATWPFQEALGTKSLPKGAFQRVRVLSNFPWRAGAGPPGRGKGEGDLAKGKHRWDLDTWPEAGGYTYTYMIPGCRLVGGDPPPMVWCHDFLWFSLSFPMVFLEFPTVFFMLS